MSKYVRTGRRKHFRDNTNICLLDNFTILSKFLKRLQYVYKLLKSLKIVMIEHFLAFFLKFDFMMLFYATTEM